MESRAKFFKFTIVTNCSWMEVDPASMIANVVFHFDVKILPYFLTISIIFEAR